MPRGKGGRPSPERRQRMSTFIPSGSFAMLAAPLPADGSGSPDLILAQLDILAAASGGTMHAISGGTVDPLVVRFSIFVLAVFVGYFVVWSVTPALHTPLMSVTNAISSVIVVGALLAVTVETADALSSSGSTVAKIFGFLALVMASINIFGGFLVT